MSLKCEELFGVVPLIAGPRLCRSLHRYASPRAWRKEAPETRLTHLDAKIDHCSRNQSIGDLGEHKPPPIHAFAEDGADDLHHGAGQADTAAEQSIGISSDLRGKIGKHRAIEQAHQHGDQGVNGQRGQKSLRMEWLRKLSGASVHPMKLPAAAD